MALATWPAQLLYCVRGRAPSHARILLVEDHIACVSDIVVVVERADKRLHKVSGNGARALLWLPA